MIVLDEEHEASYKNGETPRYHAREVAAVRARLEGAGAGARERHAVARDDGATVKRRLRLLRLPERIGARPLPPVELVDLRVAPKVSGHRARVAWSEALDAGRSLATLARREQALLLLNRRGFAAFLQCPDCGEVWQCPRCSISLTVHRAPAGLRCHYCGHEEPLPFTCRDCANPVQQMRGFGTQQLERLLTERYPEARLARMDLDTTSTKWSHQRILASVEAGEVDLLLGTQMIAKGLDFPNVTLVGVVDADTGLYLPDFRSAERTFQLLAQVAGRAGRGPKGGRVLVQTRHPAHHALVWAAQHDAEGFLREERALRESPPYPPATALVNLLVPGPDSRGRRRAAELADWCAELVAKYHLPVTLLGPAPCPLARIKERWRWHVLLKGPSEALGRIVRYAAPAADAGGDGAGRHRSGSGVAALTVQISRAAGPELHRCPPSRARYPISVPEVDDPQRGAGSNTRPPAPFIVSEPTYCRSQRLFMPMKGAEFRLPTTPSQPSRRLVTPGTPRVVRGSGVLGSSAAIDELSVWSASGEEAVGQGRPEPEPPVVIGHAGQAVARRTGRSRSDSRA